MLIEGDFQEAMTETLLAKGKFTAIDIRNRACRLIEKEISFGTTLMRAHVEVDPIIGLKSLQVIIQLRKEYEDLITIQIAVFAQEGITNHIGQFEMMREAMIMGGDVISSAPYCDPDPVSNICIIFDLAKEFNCPVDFHLDYHLGGKPSFLHCVIDETIKRGWQNRVVLGHMTALSCMNTVELEIIGGRLREAGIMILALPASDICMMARADDGNKRRGVCPIDKLSLLGVNTAYATNNIQNLFTFTGDGDVLKIGTLVCQLLQMTSEAGASLCLEMATTSAAKALGVDHYLGVGMPADIVLMTMEDSPSRPKSSIRPSMTDPVSFCTPCASPAMLLLSSPPIERIVIKKGKVVSNTTFRRSIYR
jgi:cytosine deaminase